MSIYEENLKFFRENAPQLYEILDNEVSIWNVEIKEQDSNNCILSSNGINCFMHSIYDIENEMQMMFKNVENDVEAIVLFGIGNGYALEYIRKNHKKLKALIVIESSLEIFKRSLKLYDFHNLFSDSWDNEINITFITNRNKDFIADITVQQSILGKKIAIVNHPYSLNVFSENHRDIHESLSKQLKITVGSFSTVNIQWKLWLINTIRNLKQNNIVPIEAISNIFKNKTVIIVSAGPSLNKNIKLIEKFKEKAIIIAVGSAIKVLDSKGITPHFRIAIDAYEIEKVVVDNIDTESSSFMFSNQLYFDILPNYKGNKIRYILNSDFLGKYIYNKGGLKYIEFASGPSVANGVLELACKLEAKRIIFMGQDLSYTEERLHSEGISAEAEKIDEEWLKTQNYIEIENIYGDKVYTLHPFLQMKYVMEKTIENYNKVEFLNATEGGLFIEGANNITAQEVLEKKLRFENGINLEILDRLLNDSAIKKEYYGKIENGLKVMASELEELIVIQKEIIKFLLKFEKMNINNSNRFENELSYIEKLIKKLTEISLYKEVIEIDLRADLTSLIINHKYLGNNKNEIREAKRKLIIGSSNKISEHIELCVELLNE